MFKQTDTVVVSVFLSNTRTLSGTRLAHVKAGTQETCFVLSFHYAHLKQFQKLPVISCFTAS